MDNITINVDTVKLIIALARTAADDPETSTMIRQQGDLLVRFIATAVRNSNELMQYKAGLVPVPNGQPGDDVPF